MTTKQEIINYIRNIEKFDIDVHDTLIQMIKDLKPTVKKIKADFTLQEAQEACQRHYEETILSALEN